MSILNLLIFILVKIIHLFLILFIVIIPFTDSIYLISLHIPLTICIIFHWLTNSDICFLSIVEGYLSGKHYTETFIHSIVSPVYNIDENSLNKVIWWSTILLLFISIYKISKNNNYKHILELLHKKID